MAKTFSNAHHHTAAALHGSIASLFVRTVSTWHFPNGLLAESSHSGASWFRYAKTFIAGRRLPSLLELVDPLYLLQIQVKWPWNWAMKQLPCVMFQACQDPWREWWLLSYCGCLLSAISLLGLVHILQVQDVRLDSAQLQISHSLLGCKFSFSGRHISSCLLCTFKII